MHTHAHNGKPLYFGTDRVTDHLNKEAGMCWGSAAFTPTIRSLTLFVQSPAALMSLAFSRSFTQSCFYLKHMASCPLPTHVTSDPCSTPQHIGVNAGSNLCLGRRREITSAWSNFVSVQKAFIWIVQPSLTCEVNWWTWKCCSLNNLDLVVKVKSGICDFLSYVKVAVKTHFWYF